MKTPNIVVMSAAVLVLGVGNAAAASCNQEIMDVSKMLVASDAGTGPTTGSPKATAGDQKGQHPGTSLMNKEMAGKAASPEDVQRQSGVKSAASEALERARTFSVQGKEQECMNEVKNARQLAGR